MNLGQAYATIVIPPRFTDSVLEISGLPSSGARPPVKPTIQLLTNPRAGTLGVGLATGVVQPAVGRIDPDRPTALAGSDSDGHGERRH
jgi:hypothetical protein